MSEFNRIKITLAVGLLAAAFALGSQIDSLEHISYEAYGFTFSPEGAYWAFVLLMGSAVYMYAIAFLNDRISLKFRNVGDVLYVFALGFVPVYLLLFTSLRILEAILNVPNLQQYVDIASVVAPILSLALAATTYFFMREKEKTERIATANLAAVDSLSKARDLIDEDRYDLGVLEAWRAVEPVLAERVGNFSKDFSGALIKARDDKKISIYLAAMLRILREYRNRAVHSRHGEIKQDDAKSSLGIAESILKYLEHSSDRKLIVVGSVNLMLWIGPRKLPEVSIAPEEPVFFHIRAENESKSLQSIEYVVTNADRNIADFSKSGMLQIAGGDIQESSVQILPTFVGKTINVSVRLSSPNDGGVSDESTIVSF